MTAAKDFVKDLAETALAHEAARPAYLIRLTAGDLPEPIASIRLFAFQYAAYSRHFPRYVQAVIGQLASPEHKALLQDNLDEECGRAPAYDVEDRHLFATRPHTELFADFQSAIGIDDAYRSAHEILPEIAKWPEAMLVLCNDPNPAKGVGAIGLGTELVVPRIYAQILKALDRHTALSGKEKIFFTLHAQLDHEHADAFMRVAEDFAHDESGRDALRDGMMAALDLRVGFWNTLLRESLVQDGPARVAI